MKIQITLNNVTVEKEIPMSWNEVTFGQFLKLLKAGDDQAEVLSVFTDVDAETLRKAKIINLNSILLLLNFLKTEMDFKQPDSVLGYKIPKDLEFETIGQFQDLKLELIEMAKKENKIEAFEHYTKILAIYAVNPYDYKEAEALAPLFLKAPAPEVVAVGNFTLAKLVELINGIKVKSLKPNTPMRKFRQALTNYLKGLVFMARFYTWRRKLRLIEKNY